MFRLNEHVECLQLQRGNRNPALLQKANSPASGNALRKSAYSDLPNVIRTAAFNAFLSRLGTSDSAGYGQSRCDDP